MLYSKDNQYPKALPFRIVLSNGMTRTDPTTFTKAEIADAGYVAVDDKPVLDENQRLGWEENGWVVFTKTQEELDADAAYVLASNKAARAEAYRNESDPLFFKAQRNEIPMADWIAKVNEIKTLYPDPTV
jgi:hypothetical protein